VVLGAAGCASVPDTTFLKHETPPALAQLHNAWGPIPAKTSAAIVAELKRKSGDLDILDRQIAIEQAVVGKPLVVGNKVNLLLDGPATYQAMLAAIRQARSTINIEFYIIEDGEVGERFTEALLERRAAGVEVNVIYDSVGAFKTPKEFFDRWRQAGIRVLEFNPVNPLAARKAWKLNHRDHRKLLVVDGQTAFLGGINIDDVYSTGSSSSGGSSGGSGSSSGGSKGKGKDEKRSGWRDTDIQLKGPIVTDLQNLFLQTWEKQKGPDLGPKEKYLPIVKPEGKEIVRAIGSTPDDAYSASYLTFIAALTNAQKQAYITNAYFVPDPQLVEALLDAAKRDVDVRLILPSTTDSRSAAYAAHSFYTRLLEGGVKIYERRAALLHAKTAVIDGVWSCVGSSNLDWRSAVDNDELNAVILSREFAQQMLAAYALDQAKSDEIDLEHWKHRPYRQRIKEWIFRVCGRLL
jgi:cardiolipin synthase A/B